MTAETTAVSLDAIDAALAAGCPAGRCRAGHPAAPAGLRGGQRQQEAPGSPGRTVPGFRGDDQRLTFQYGGRSIVWCTG
jgi:hypothetical protein